MSKDTSHWSFQYKRKSRLFETVTTDKQQQKEKKRTKLKLKLKFRTYTVKWNEHLLYLWHSHIKQQTGNLG